MFRLFRQYARPHIWLILLVLVAQITQTAASLWLPSLNADIIDRGVVTGDTAQIWHYGSLMLAMTVVQVVATLVAMYYGAKVGTLMSHGLRRDTFANVQTFARTEIQQFEAASLITRATNDIQTIQMVTILILTEMIMGPLIGVGGMIMAVRQDAGLSLLLLAVVPLLGISMGWLMWSLQPWFRLTQQRTDKINAVLREQLTGARVVRAFVRQDSERERFQQRNTDLLNARMGLSFLFSLVFPILNILLGLSSIGVIWFGAIRIDTAGMEVGSMIAFLNYLIQIFGAIMVMSFIFMMLPRGHVAAERVQAVLNTTASITSPEQPHDLGHDGPTVFACEGVSVQYPGAELPVLHDVNVEFTPGHTTAIIGSTGSGKSTLAALLPRLHDPSSGKITANGVDIRELDVADLRSRIAYVPQTAYLFSGTVASTVSGIPAEHITEDVRQRVRAALATAQAQGFVNTLPQGIDAPVTAGGKNFSGGQRQRLTIARALYRHADLYVFDDSFSALDYATEARVRADLTRTIDRNAAVVMIAQRVSTIAHANVILVLDKGQVVGRGTHAELLESCSTYQEIVASQLDPEEAA